jgi:RNA polymerase sigma factor (sigma-70 family)
MAGTAERDLGSIVESAARGDEIAFGRIVAAYQEQMYSICVVMCRDRSLAEEAVQLAWSRIWRKLGTVREAAKLRPWAISIAVNEARQLLRKRRARARVEVTADPAERPGGIDPATGIAGLDLRDAMGRLDPDDRALLTMRYVLGFEATELATAIGLSPAATRQRLKRLLDRLRRDLV